jgi:hypothetical protein
MPPLPQYQPAKLGVPRGFCPEGIPSRERQRLTTQFLRETAYLQTEIMLVALKARRPFERWVAPILCRHWHQALLRWKKANEKVNEAPAEDGAEAGTRVLPTPEPFPWNESIASLRSTDLYMTKGDEAPARRNTTLSVRACHLEAWVLRYLASAYPEKNRIRGARAIAKGAGVTGAFAEALQQRLLLGAEERRRLEIKAKLLPEGGYWSLEAIADGMYNLLDWNYIARMETCCEAPEDILVKRYVSKTMDLFDAVIHINRPAGIQIAKAWHDSTRIHKVHVSLDDLIDTTMIAVNHAACRFNYHLRFTFAGVAKAAINSHLRRWLVDERPIRIPEESAIALHKHVRWAADWQKNHPGQPMPVLADQLAMARVRVSPECFREVQQTSKDTHILPLHEIANDPANRENFASEVLLSDQGAGARAVRGDIDNPAVIRLKRIFRHLSPLYQGVLNCFAPCTVTDDGDQAWLEETIDTMERLVSDAARRAERGVETRVPSGLKILHG